MKAIDVPFCGFDRIDDRSPRLLEKVVPTEAIIRWSIGILCGYARYGTEVLSIAHQGDTNSTTARQAIGRESLGLKFAFQSHWRLRPLVVKL